MSKPTIGAFIPYLGGFFMGEITTYLRYWACQHDFNLIIIRTNSFGTYDTALAINHCDAFLSVLNAISPEFAAALPDERPFVTIGCNDYVEYRETERVFSDHQNGIKQVFKHLVGLGHKKIGYMADFNIVDMRLRFDAYKECLEEYQSPFREEYILRANEPSMEGGREACEHYFRHLPDFTALITSADLMALGFIQGLQSKDLSCPDDLAITGYEATSLAWHFKPGITSVDQRMCDVVKKAFDRLYIRLNGGEFVKEVFYIPQQLYIGESCGAPTEKRFTEQQYIELRSSGIAEFQAENKTVKSTESLTAFAKAGFESLISTSYIFGPFMTEGYRARWQGEDIHSCLNIYSHFDISGQMSLAGKVRFQAEDFPPIPEIEDAPYVLNILPITAGDTDWEVIAIYDSNRKNSDYENLAQFYNYMDMISFSLERDAFSLISKRREEEGRILTEQVVSLNSNLEKRVRKRTEELDALNDSLVLKNKELEEISQYKTDFISNMSHELRTPLNSIVGFTRRLVRQFEKDQDEKTLESLHAIKRNSDRLIDLISDVLDVSKIEAGYMSLNIVRADLIKVTEYIANDLRSLAENKGLTLNFSSSASHKNIFTQIDQKRIEQVITNLISNAIKYTEAGQINIEVGMTHYKQLGLCNFFSVRDTGMGIPDSAIDKLFGKFGRLEKHERSTIVGTGLGLAIVKEIVSLHHGHIEVESVEGKGSNFTVYLPG